MSLPHSKRHIYIFKTISPLLWIDLDVIYDFTNKNLKRKPFTMIAGVKIPGIIWGLLNFM